MDTEKAAQKIKRRKSCKTWSEPEFATESAISARGLLFIPKTVILGIVINLLKQRPTSEISDFKSTVLQTKVKNAIIKFPIYIFYFDNIRNILQSIDWESLRIRHSLDYDWRSHRYLPQM